MSEGVARTILCALDLSPQSADVLGWTRVFAGALHARVEVLHALWLEEPPYFTNSQIGSLAAAIKAQKSHAIKHVERLAKKVMGDVPHDITVREGHALEVIRQRLREKPYQLLVVGSHGHTPTQRLLLGSVAEELYRDAIVPTLVVKAPLRQSGVRRIVCPVNLSEIAADCAVSSGELARRLGADLTMLRIVEDGTHDGAAAREQLCQWIPQEARQRCNLSEAVAHGDPAEQVVKFAESEAIDLIAIGAARRKFLQMFTVGRTTEKVVRHATSTVLVVPPHAANAGNLTPVPQEQAATR